MNILNVLTAMTLAACVSFATDASAALLNFDLNDECGAGCDHLNAFQFNTETEEFQGISFPVKNGVTLTKGTGWSQDLLGGTGPVTHTVFYFTDAAMDDTLSLRISADIFSLGLAVGGSVVNGFDGDMMGASGPLIGAYFDTSLTITRLADPVSAVPLPAGLPLLATALAAVGLGATRRRKT